METLKVKNPNCAKKERGIATPKPMSKNASLSTLTDVSNVIQEIKQRKTKKVRLLRLSGYPTLIHPKRQTFLLLKIRGY